MNDQDWLKNNNFFASKKMGQNFLIDPDISSAIVQLLPEIRYDEIIEIGPGMGAITELLLQTSAKPVNAIELDKRLYAYLKKKFHDKKNLNLFNDDFLDFDWKKINDHADFFVVANIPYSITTPIVLKCMQNPKIKGMYIMVQKEVGLKWTRDCCKNRNAFTNLIYFYFETQIILEIDRTNFYPQPKVDSMMIYLQRKPNRIYDPDFYRFLQKFFLFKRKKIKNNIDQQNEQKITFVLNKNGFDLNARAEQISAETWYKIYHDWLDLCTKK